MVGNSVCLCPQLEQTLVYLANVTLLPHEQVPYLSMQLNIVLHSGQSAGIEAVVAISYLQFVQRIKMVILVIIIPNITDIY
jgi:hypothetical protein